MPDASTADAAAAGDLVLVAVPWDGHAELLRELEPALASNLVVDCVNPLGFDTHGAFALAVEEGSATQQAATIPPRSTVVGPFHHVSAVLVEDPKVDSVDTDGLVLGDDGDATELVRALARQPRAGTSSIRMLKLGSGFARRGDGVLEQWRRERPDMDVWPVGIVGRIMRLSRFWEADIKRFLAGHGLEPGEFDVLSTLRRTGHPHELSAAGFLASSW